MYNNLKSHQFLSCIFVLVLATGCQFDFTKTRKTRQEVKKLEKVAAAAYKKIQGYGYIEQESSKTGTAEDKSISILDIPNPSNEIKTLYKKITDAISAAETKDATLATVSAQLEFLIALLQACAYAIEAEEARIQGSTVVDRATITKQIKPAVDVKDQRPEGPALQQAQEALTQLQALVKQIKTKAREDVGTALKEAADAQKELSAIQEVKEAVIPIKVDLERIRSKQDADAPTAVQAAKEATALLEVLQAILEAQKAVQGLTEETVKLTEETVKEAEKAVEEAEKAVEEKAQGLEDIVVKPAIKKAVTALQTQLEKVSKQLPKGDAQKSEKRVGNSSGPGDSTPPVRAASGAVGGARTGEIKPLISESVGFPVLSDLSIRQLQDTVKQFRASVLGTKKIFKSKEEMEATWNKVQALFLSTEEECNNVTTWLNAISSLPGSSRISQQQAKTFAELNDKSETQDAINKVMKELIKDSSEALATEQTETTSKDAMKIVECFRLLGEIFAQQNSQSPATAQTPMSSTP